MNITLMKIGGYITVFLFIMSLLYLLAYFVVSKFGLLIEPTALATQLGILLTAFTALVVGLTRKD